MRQSAGRRTAFSLATVDCLFEVSGWKRAISERFGEFGESDRKSVFDFPPLQGGAENISQAARSSVRISSGESRGETMTSQKRDKK